MLPGLCWLIVLAVLKTRTIEQVDIFGELPQCRGSYVSAVYLFIYLAL